MKFLFLWLILIPFPGLAQQTQIQQLQFLLGDLRNNFKETIGTAIPRVTGDSAYLSKINLEGSMDNEIDFAKDKKKWVSYTAYIRDSCNLKEAKRLVEFWRGVAHNAAPSFNEKKMDGKHKTFSGHSVFGYDFEMTNTNYKYWISISYAERPLGNGYSVLLILGKQLQ